MAFVGTKTFHIDKLRFRLCPNVPYDYNTLPTATPTLTRIQQPCFALGFNGAAIHHVGNNGGYPLLLNLSKNSTRYPPAITAKAPWTSPAVV